MSRNLLVAVGSICLAVIVVAASLLIGTADITVREVVSILASGRGDASTMHRIVWDLRMPRGLLAFFVGGGLAVVGVGMQALVRNPLAEPYILGVSSGASAGAALFYLGFLPAVVSQSVSMPVAAFIGGLGSLILVYLVARTRTHISVTRLLLAGVAMSALMGAVTAFITFASPDPARLRAVLFWLMGSLGGARWDVLWIPMAVSLIGFLVLLMMSRGLDALLLGEEQAWNLGMSQSVSMPVAAFIGGLGSLILVYLVARTRTHISVTRLLLAGVAMSALMGAVTAFITFASPDPARLRAVLFWLMGSLGGARWDVLWIPMAVSLIGFLVLLMMSRGLDALLLGEEQAWNLGMSVERLKHVLLVLAAFITGPLVAAVGVIGFVGLIIPHIVRMLVGVRHTPLLISSYFLGGAFIAATDAIARSLLHSQELPIGVLTAICGVPFFLWLLRSSHYRFG